MKKLVPLSVFIGLVHASAVSSAEVFYQLPKKHPIMQVYKYIFTKMAEVGAVGPATKAVEFGEEDKKFLEELLHHYPSDIAALGFFDRVQKRDGLLHLDPTASFLIDHLKDVSPKYQQKAQKVVQHFVKLYFVSFETGPQPYAPEFLELMSRLQTHFPQAYEEGLNISLLPSEICTY